MFLYGNRWGHARHGPHTTYSPLPLDPPLLGYLSFRTVLQGKVFDDLLYTPLLVGLADRVTKSHGRGKGQIFADRERSHDDVVL